MVLEDVQCSSLALELSKRVFVDDLGVSGIIKDGGGNPGLECTS